MKKLIFIFLIIYLVFSIFYLNAKEDDKLNILQNQPVFELKIEGLGAMYFIEMNGIIVLKQYNSSGKIQTRLPVNHYMKSGENTLKISTWSGDNSPINPNAYVNIELIVSENTQPNNEFIISTLRLNNREVEENKTISSSAAGIFNSEQGFKPDEQGDVIISEVTAKQEKNVLTYSRTLVVPSSLPLWAFFTSDELPNYISMSDEEYYQHMDILLAEYKKVQNAIENNDINSITSMFEERNNELDAAFYNPPGTLAEKIKVALQDAADDDSATLVELKKSTLDFDTSKNNRLNRLARRGKKSAIVLNYKEISGSYRFDMIFRMKGGKWLLTR